MDDHIDTNKALWSETNRLYTDQSAERSWSKMEITWGVFEIPERGLNVIGDVRGLDVVELGCGTAYFSSWLARRGARAVGVDVTPAQLATARRCQEKFGLTFPLVEANAEATPLPTAAFDLALSEYGASLWCDPERWIPEAARLLRPGGRLIFLTNSPLVTMCMPDDENAYAGTQLLHSKQEIERQRAPDAGIEFHPSHGEWLAILRKSGFTVDQLLELHAPKDATTHEFYKVATSDWAQRWPVEDLWVATKR